MRRGQQDDMSLWRIDCPYGICEWYATAMTQNTAQKAFQIHTGHCPNKKHISSSCGFYICPNNCGWLKYFPHGQGLVVHQQYLLHCSSCVA